MDKSRAKGGHARAAALTKEERQEIARKAAIARWAGDLPEATHAGNLEIGDMTIPCAVLADGTRVLTESDFMKNMGMYRSGALSVRRKAESEGGAQVPLYLAFKNLKPYVDKHLGDVHKASVRYRTGKGNIAHGISAELIPRICEIWLDAEKDGVLGKRQKQIAARADLVIRGLAHVGIIALVDEATGYQEVRDKKALQAILDKFLRKELAAWAKKFPDDFYKEMFRLRNWEWRGMKVNRPSVVGKYTNDLVYERIAPGLLQELQRKNPKKSDGSRKAKHHQWLTEDVGDPALAQHLHALVGLMRASTDWMQFKRLVDRAFPKRGQTLELPMDDYEQV